MTIIRAIISKGSLALIIALFAAMPLTTFTTVSADTNGDCTPPPESSYGPGVRRPAGASAKAFIYQCPDPANPYAGLWVSEYYIYYPETNTTKPKEPVVYTYNNDTNKYDYEQWQYSPVSEGYRLVAGSVSTPPAGAKVIGAPAPKPQPTPTSSSSSDTSSDVTTGSTATANPGTTTATGTTNTNGKINNNNGAAVNNTIGSTATSGNALVMSNTTGGNATSGNAITQANVTNMLQSSSNAIGSGTDVATFTYTIDGDVTGDLFFDPSLVNGVQDDAGDNTLSSNLTINNTSNASITNDLTLASTSGDATVSNNTTGGNATTGSASAVANIINSIHSAITAGKSFVGTINITGNLNGDILLPANFVDQLVAANVPTVAVAGPSSTSNNTTITNTNNQSITNTVTSQAQSGSATVAGNTKGGTASSGQANTNVTAFNLTGSKVVAKNSILVFVNVTGKWTGLIVNAPAGATAAMLGSGVSSNTNASSNTNINNTTNQRIDNTVNVTATSGDASVISNTTGGNAASGDTRTAVNLVNIEDSTIQLSDWFGILFINVFGTWNGSFGINTDAGTVYAQQQTGGTGLLVGNVSKLVRYPATATTSQSAAPKAAAAQQSAAAEAAPAQTDDAVLAAQTHRAPTPPQAPQLSDSQASNLWLPALGAILGLAILGSERIFTKRPGKSSVTG